MSPLLTQGNCAVFDLFAGPGGWDMGARSVGLDPIGFEWDDAACETRRAAVLRALLPAQIEEKAA